MREYDSHTPGFGGHGTKHMLDPGIVTTCAWWHTSNIATIGVSEPEIFAPMFKRKGRIGDDTVKGREKVSFKESGLAQGIAPDDLEIFNSVQKEVDTRNTRGGEVLFLSVEFAPECSGVSTFFTHMMYGFEQHTTCSAGRVIDTFS